jgi:hypothetical protein
MLLFSCKNNSEVNIDENRIDSVALEYERSLTVNPYYKDGLRIVDVEEYLYVVSNLDTGDYVCLIDTVSKTILKCAIVRSLAGDTLVETWDKKNDYFIKTSLDNFETFYAIKHHDVIFYRSKELDDVSGERNRKKK